jgi:hypothetical protein
LQFLSYTLPTVIIDTANWWEPGTPNVLDIGDIAIYLSALIAFAAVVAGTSKVWSKSLRKIVREEIEIATAPIHPKSNGGLSLADVARKTEDLETSLNKISTQNEETRTILLQVLANSVYIPIVVPEKQVKKPTRKKVPTPSKKDN